MELRADFSEPSATTLHPAARLIVLEGMPGAGKTTLARALASEGAPVLGEYITAAGATIPLSDHPSPGDSAAHDANWIRKARQAAIALRGAAAVYADRDWLSALAYAYSIADTDDGQMLRQRCERTWISITQGELLLADIYVVFHVSAATSLRRRSESLQGDHPWSRHEPLQRLRYFYTWPAQVICTEHPGLAAALLAPAWHRFPGTGSVQTRLRLLRELGTAS